MSDLEESGVLFRMKRSGPHSTSKCSNMFMVATVHYLKIVAADGSMDKHISF